MKKVGRNEPCPCGSGLKFKKCCGNNNVVQLNPSRFDDELEELSAQMIEYALEHHSEKVQTILNDYSIHYGIDGSQEDKEHFVALLLPWVLMHEPFLEGHTLYEVFLKEKIDDIKFDKVKDAFSNWKKTASSFFEILSVETTGNEFITLKDIVTSDQYTIKQTGIDASHIGNIIVGTLLPGIFKDHFFYATIGLPEEMKSIVHKQRENLQFNREFMNEKYPPTVAMIINPPTNVELEWADPSHEKVFQLYSESMKAKKVEERIIKEMFAFWHHFSSKHRPIIRKEIAYVAALDYFTNVAYLSDDKVTQKMVSDEYGVSSTTISRHYSKFMDEFNKQ